MEKNGIILQSFCSDFYCLNCFHSFATKNKLKSHKRVCENEDVCNIIMPSGNTKILELNQNQKSDKAPFIIYVDLECLMNCKFVNIDED